MDMLVPLNSTEAATCSRSLTFKYTPLHVQDPSLDDMPCPLDYKLPSPKCRENPSFPGYGIDYAEDDLIDFQPEVSGNIQLFQFFYVYYFIVARHYL